MTIVVLNPISVEFEAMIALLPSTQEQWKGGLAYTCSKLSRKHGILNLIIRETGSGVTNIALATEKAIKDWQPTVLLLVGVAGGIKDVAIGDIVVATKAYGYESGKETPDGFVARPDAIPCVSKLIDLSKTVARQGIWANKLTSNNQQASVYFGPIVSGEKVIASKSSATYAIIKKHYNDTLAVEMESIGFARVCLQSPLIQWANIRSISDQIDGKSKVDSAGMQKVAAEQAAAFTFELLQNLHLIDLNISPMKLKELVKEIFTIITPFISMESTKEIGKDLKAATNTTINELWEKVKPLFIEEYEDLKEDPVDTDAQAAVRNKLRRSLQNDEALQKELTVLVKMVKETPEGKYIVRKGKNVVQGSNLSAGGNIHIGDKK